MKRRRVGHALQRGQVLRGGGVPAKDFPPFKAGTGESSWRYQHTANVTGKKVSVRRPARTENTFVPVPEKPTVLFGVTVDAKEGFDQKAVMDPCVQKGIPEIRKRSKMGVIEADKLEGVVAADEVFRQHSVKMTKAVL